MTLLSKTAHIRILRNTDAAIDIMPFAGEQHETAGGPLDGEIITVARVEYIDELGGVIGPDSTIVRDAITGRPTALCNAFRCDICGKFHALCYLAKKSENIPAPQAPALGNAASVIRTGICETCWEKARTKRILAAVCRGLVVVVRFFIAPFLPEKPVVVPTAGLPDDGMQRDHQDAGSIQPSN